MSKQLLILSLLFTILLSFTACEQKQTAEQFIEQEDLSNLHELFSEYWFAGLAEISQYELTQSRYGHSVPGQATMIYVTEDFLKDKQVKADYPVEDASNKVNVLKLNATRNFQTGVYPYSIMTSVFSPTDSEQNPRAIKLTNSVQEWCGHTYTQVNKTKSGYDLRLHSYFEKEADTYGSLPDIWLEDEIWTYIRMAPHKLPVGELKALPGSVYLRLAHKAISAYKAEASLKAEGKHYIYTIRYPELNRQLSIEFEKAFPYAIMKWEEHYEEGTGKMAITSAKRLHKTRLDYWNKNQPKDSGLLNSLFEGKNPQ